jgi:hypothetical protein
MSEKKIKKKKLMEGLVKYLRRTPPNSEALRHSGGDSRL